MLRDVLLVCLASVLVNASGAQTAPPSDAHGDRPTKVDSSDGGVGGQVLIRTIEYEGYDEPPPPIELPTAASTFTAAELSREPGTFGGEPFRAALDSPGAATLLSGTPVFSERGLQPAANAYFLDGVRVPAPFHLLLGPEAIDPDLISTVKVVRDVAPIHRPNVLGAVVDAERVTPTAKPVAKIWMDALELRMLGQQRLSTGTGITVAGGIAWTPWLYAGITDLTHPPPSSGTSASSLSATLADYQLAIDHDALRVLAFGLVDDVGTTSDADAVAGALSSHRLDVRLGDDDEGLHVTFGRDSIAAFGGGSASKEGFDLVEYSLATRLSVRLNFERFEVLAGLDWDYRKSEWLHTTLLRPGAATDPSRPTIVDRQLLPVATYSIPGAYAQWVAKLGTTTVLTAGLRAADYHLVPGIDFPALEPRVAAKVSLRGNLDLRASAALVHQTPTMLLDLPAAGGFGLPLGIQEAVKLDVGADVPLAILHGLQVSVDAYLDPLVRAIELSPFDSDFLADPRTLTQRVSHGIAYGVELSARRQLSEHWFGGITYSFQQSTRGSTIERHDANGAVNGLDVATLPSQMNQQHVVNAVASYELGGGWIVGAGLHFHSGLPENGGFAGVTEQQGVNTVGVRDWIPQDLDRTARLPPFFRADVRVSKTWTPRWGRIEAFLDALNVTLSKEVVRYNYSASAPSLADAQAGNVTLTKSPFGLPPITVPLLGVKASL